jgi:hypothetical protein
LSAPSLKGAKKSKSRKVQYKLVFYNKKIVQDLKRTKKGLFLQSGKNGPIVQLIYSFAKATEDEGMKVSG